MKREGVIVDINMLYKKVTPANPDPNNNMAQNDIDDLMEMSHDNFTMLHSHLLPF